MQSFTPETITETINEMEQFFDKQGIMRDTVIRSRIALEEILLMYQDEVGKTGQFAISFTDRLGQVKAQLSVPGDSFNPFDPEDEDKQSLVLMQLLKSFPDKPKWRYNKKLKCNEVLFEPYSENSLPRNAAITWSYLKNYKGGLIKAILFQAVELAMQIVIPLVTAELVTAYTESVFLQIAIMVAVVFGLELVSAFCYHMYNHAYEKAYHDAVEDLEADLARSVHTTNLDSVDNNGTGMIIQRMTVETVQLISGFGELAAKLSVITKGVGLLIATLIINWGAFVITLLSLVCSSFIELRRVDEMNENDIAYRKANERLFGDVTEMVRGTRDVRLLGCDNPFIENIASSISEAADRQLEMNEDNLGYHMEREFSDIAWNLLYLAYLGLMMYFGYLTAVYAIILFNYRSSIREIPGMLGESMQYLKQFNLSAGRIFSLMYNPEFFKEKFGDGALDDCKGRIEFKNVSFSYYANSLNKRRRKVLQRVNLTVEPGQIVAIVGSSGCGKSTILNLIEKLYVPGSGKILLDGRNLEDLSQSAIRDNVVMVSQLPYIFSMSIRENLALVKPDMTDEEMHEACRIACVDDEFSAMPDGFDTVVGENGTSLSGGQAQRLAIARALLRDPKVLLLDEATSALDNTIQQKVYQNLIQLMEGRTIVMATHRLATAVKADVIHYMKNGKIAASGTHEELLETCVDYAQQFVDAGKKEE